MTIKPIKELLLWYLHKANFSIDPFARDCPIADITNDLNPNANSQYHLTAEQFLLELNHSFDFVIFDPPYSLTQVKRSYDSIGLKLMQSDTQNFMRWSKERKLIADKIAPNGTVMSFGWSTCAMGQKLGFEIQEIMIISHGSGHNDTLVTVETKLPSVGIEPTTSHNILVNYGTLPLS